MMSALLLLGEMGMERGAREGERQGGREGKEYKHVTYNLGYALYMLCVLEIMSPTNTHSMLPSFDGL